MLCQHLPQKFLAGAMFIKDFSGGKIPYCLYRMSPIWLTIL